MTKTRFLFSTMALLAVSAPAAVVHVFEQMACGGVTNVLSDVTTNTLSTYTTQEAPVVDGWLFTRWTTDAHQTIVDRDPWGRALDAAVFTVYEETTLTANYLPADTDADVDGMADAWEIYWYGDLDETPDSDTDGDGLSFAFEVQRGSNPLFPDAYAPGPVMRGDSDPILYNPNGWAPYVIRSEPEGVLFETITGHAEPGTEITTTSWDPATSVFAQWTVNGRRVQDPWGRAADAVTFIASATEITEAVAWCMDGDFARQARYWYGDAGAAADSDTDGDGLPFAQELARGSSPLFPDLYAPGPVMRGDSAIVQYNPHGYVAYVIRSEPEGALFETMSDYLLPGATVNTPTLDPATSSFSGWTLNGVRQADAWGRALDSLTLVGAGKDDLIAVAETDDAETTRHSRYWYGDETVDDDADTDGDGYTLAQEVARGSNPLFPDSYAPGPVMHERSEAVEANLQPFEQLRTALVVGAAEEVFTSPTAGNAAEAWVFGADLSPGVADLDGDGLFDLVLADAGGVRVLRNAGAPASPDFTEVADPFAGLAAAFAAADAADRVIAGGEGGVYLAGDPIRFFPADGSAATETALSGVPASFGGELFALDPATGSVATTNGALALDTPIVRGLSIAVADADGDGLADLLASDDEGRVWFYKSQVAGPMSQDVRPETCVFVLQHKVWGGTHAGFAEGLKIAAVDWDDDGDLDALGGTAAGRLLMLRDPRIGRPANARIVSGLNSVVLSWEPNTQSRVRGYRVYRAPGAAEAAEAAAFERLTSPWTPLPTYRDYPPDIRDYAYRVTTMSRFYTAGNSTPTETESRPTDLLSATLGGVTLSLRDAAGFAGEEIDVGLAVNNSLGLAASGMELAVEYDPVVLTPVEAVPAGLGATLEISSSVDPAAGVWTIRATGGEVAAGAGTLLTLRFEAAEDYEGEATVALTSAQLRATSGQTATAPTPVTGTVSIQLRNPPEPAHVAVILLSQTVAEGETLLLPVAIDTTKPLDGASVSLSVVYDPALLTPVGANAESGVALAGTAADGVWEIAGFPSGTLPAGTNVLAILEWTAAAVDADETTEIAVSALDATDADGLAAETTTPTTTMVFVTDAGGGDGGGTGGDGWEKDPDDPDDGVEGVDWHWSKTEVLFSVPNAAVRTGDTFDLPLTTELFTRWWFAPRLGADGAKFRFSISYDPAVLEPVEVVAARGATLTTTNRVDAAAGRWYVYGTGGTVPFRETTQLAFRFRAVEQYGFDRSAVDFKTARVYDTDGDRMRCWKYKIPRVVSVRFVRPPDDPRVVAPWSKGDVDGNGKLERADLERLRVLLDYAGYSGHGGHGNGHGGPGQHQSIATEQELRAGDMNENGKLEEGDYQLLYKFLKAKGAIQ